METISPQDLVKALMAAGHTQLHIQEATGISQPTISRIYSGKHKDPRSSVTERLRVYADAVLPKQGPEAA